MAEGYRWMVAGPAASARPITEVQGSKIETDDSDDEDEALLPGDFALRRDN